MLPPLWPPMRTLRGYQEDLHDIPPVCGHTQIGSLVRLPEVPLGVGTGSASTASGVASRDVAAADVQSSPSCGN